MDSNSDEVVVADLNTDLNTDLNNEHVLDSEIDIDELNKKNNYDPEKNDFTDDYIINNTSPTYIRHDFVKKVFLIVLMQLLATFSIVLACYFIESVNEFFKEVPYLGLVSGIILLGLAILIVLKPKLLHKKGLGITFICLFTFLFTVMVVTITCYYDVQEILIAMGATTVVVTGLILFAFQTKYDFTSWVGYTYILLILVIFIGLFAAFSNLKAVRIVVASILTVIISIYILIDVQLIVGGKKKYQFNVDDYLIAAITLYSDIISLFIQLLRIIGGGGNS